MNGRNHSLELFHGLAKIVVQRLVFRQFSKRAFTAVDTIGDRLHPAQYLISFVVYGRIVDEFAGRSLTVLDVAYKRVHALDHRVDSPIKLVIGHQLAHGPIAGPQVTHEPVGFKRRSIDVVEDGRVRQKLTQRAFATIDTIGHALELIAELLQVGNEVVGALDDFCDIARLGALQISALRHDLAVLCPPCDVHVLVPEQADGADGEHGVGADDVLVLFLEPQFDFDGLFRIRLRRDTHLPDVSNGDAFELHLCAGFQVVGVLEVRKNVVLRRQKARRTADEKDSEGEKRETGNYEYADSQFSPGE